jgi:hypothetical protein
LGRGCGAAAWVSLRLAENGYTNIAYMGMDISAVMIEAAGENYPPAIFARGIFLTVKYRPTILSALL